MSTLLISVTTEDTKAYLAQYYQPETGKPKQATKVLENFFRALGSGVKRGTMQVFCNGTSPVAASGTLTLVSAIATDAITIGTTTFTATSTPTLSTHWEIDGATDTLDAASLAAAINAHATVSQIVTATSATNVVTITAKQKGLVGNFIPMTSADATITASGTGFLAGGTGGIEDAGVTYSLGI